MGKYQFSDAERWAIFNAYGGVCYLCRKPVDLQTMEVDHILPEHLLDKPDDLKVILHGYGLEDTFDLNAYGNWLPACRPCNRVKSGSVFRATPIVQDQIDRARSKTAEAVRIEREMSSNRQLARALNIVLRAMDADQLGADALKPLVIKFAKLHPVAYEAMRQPPPDPDLMQMMTKPPEFRVTPFYTVLFESGAFRIVRTPYGVGHQPKADNPHSSFSCGHCGSLGPWNGNRCLSCGMMNDGD